MIRAIISDFDGTLVDTFEANYRAYQKAFAAVGLELTAERYRECFGYRYDRFMQEMGVQDKNIANTIKELKKEYYIPFAVDCMIKAGTASCEVLHTPSHWFGVTFKEDRPAVVAKFREFAEQGIYPNPLYK